MATFGQGLTDAYLGRANKIGNVHAKIGLDPQWYIGAYASILGELITSMIAGGSRAMMPGNVALARRISKLIRVAMLDMDIALSTYFVKAEEDVRTNMVSKVDVSLAALADGDLTTRVAGLPKGYETLEQHFNEAMVRLEQTIGSVTSGTHAITTGADEIRAASDDLARRTEQQAGSLAESSAAVSQITQMAQESARDINALNQSVARVHHEAVNGSNVVSNAVTAMSDIQNSAQSIARIIEMIDSIAFQTNLLALNAGVEAARVGSAGSGFAVVANEVRALAQRSAEAAEEIKNLVNQSLGHVESGVKLVGDAGTVLGGILGQITEISDAADRIAASASSQSANLAQIHGSVTEMDRVTQQNAAMVEESSAAARTMASEVKHLGQLVGGFRCNGAGAPRVAERKRNAA
jgi:methyl-accepting chemotaxis protein